MWSRLPKKRRILYKYTKACWALQTLENSRLKVSTIGELNDIMDCAPTISLDGKHQAEPTWELFKHVNERIGIISYSTRRDSLLMWAHYGDCHKGIALGFEFPDSEPGPHQGPIEYHQNNERPSLDASEFAEMIQTGSFMPNIRRLYSVKGKEWEYEEEWRRFIPLKMPFVEKSDTGLYLERLDEKWIRQIVIGAKCSKADRERLFEVTAYRFHDVEIRQAVRHPTLNCIVLQPLRFEKRS
jgi:hypothetical protein